MVLAAKLKDEERVSPRTLPLMIVCVNFLGPVAVKAIVDKRATMTVPILPLGMMDDLMGVAKCGAENLELNAYLNTKIELKKLRFHTADK